MTSEGCLVNFCHTILFSYIMVSSGTWEGVPVVLEQKTSILYKWLYLLAPRQHSLAYLCGGNTHHRERGRKPLSQARFNAKRGENQGFLPTIDVESDPRFAPQLYALTHGSTFPVRLLREPREFCRKFAFLRPNAKIVCRKINGLHASTFLFSVICDRTLMLRGDTTTNEIKFTRQRTLLRPRLYDQTKQMPYQATRRSGEVLLIKGLRAIAAGQRATASVPHKVTGLAGDYRKRLAIKQIAGAMFPSGCHTCGSPRTEDTATGQEVSRATSAA
jgi:hypothetical protein